MKNLMLNIRLARKCLGQKSSLIVKNYYFTLDFTLQKLCATTHSELVMLWSKNNNKINRTPCKCVVQTEAVSWHYIIQYAVQYLCSFSKDLKCQRFLAKLSTSGISILILHQVFLLPARVLIIQRVFVLTYFYSFLEARFQCL